MNSFSHIADTVHKPIFGTDGACFLVEAAKNGFCSPFWRTAVDALRVCGLEVLHS